MGGLVFLVVIGTAIWVLADAKSIGVKKGQLSGFCDLGPWGWFFGCLALWIVVFPLYLSKRTEYKHLSALNKDPLSVRLREIAELEAEVKLGELRQRKAALPE